ncbi:septum formation initiator family protein [Candidatus Bipolaricaulota bacterium]|nr:septum formation initiator family protein [Candidatus Bipolaricaulota bacterium]
MGAESKKDTKAGLASGKKLVSTLLIVAVLILGLLGWIYWNRFQEIFDLQAEIERLRDEGERLRGKISELEGELKKRNDLDYFEKLAREELGLVYPEQEES